MTPIDRTIHEAACSKLSFAFAAHVDAREFQHAAELFCDDAIWEHVTGVFRGPREIGDALEALPADTRTRHFVTVVALDVIAEDKATGRSYVMLHQGVSAAEALPVLAAAPIIAENADEYRQTEGRWKIFRRTTQLVFRPDGL